MNSTTVTPPSRARRRSVVFAIIGIIAALVVGFAVQQSLAAASVSVSPGQTTATGSPGQTTATGEKMPSGEIDGSVVAPSEIDGVIRDGDQPTVFDVDRVAVSKLDPALLAALQRAATDAADSGVTLLVNSGWRSPALQDRMLQDAIAQYGSETEASRWVASSATSAHVSGDAVDLGPLRTLDWMAQHGADYGLCQIYGNESWHYELRPDAVTQGCPRMYTDPTEDPRMQR